MAKSILLYVNYLFGDFWKDLKAATAKIIQTQEISQNLSLP